MNKTYLYLGVVMALVVIFSAATFFDFFSKDNKNLVVEKVLEVADTKEASIKASNVHDDGRVMREIVLPRVAAINNEINYSPFPVADKDKEFVKENVTQLADILDISNPAELDILGSIAQRQTANAKVISDNYSSLTNEASEIISLEIKQGTLSDENKARLESIEAELLQLGEESRKNAIVSGDEIRNLLGVDQQQNLMEYEKSKIVAFRTESLSIFLTSF